jgi:TM2 domain-containing membrane protein YozV
MGRVLLSGRRGALYVNDINMDLGSMDVQREMLIEQRVANDAKSPLVAYLLLFFLWGLGVHRMYLGRWVSGILMAVLWGLGWLTWPLLIGMPVVGLVSLWVIIDIFLIPGMIEDDKNDMRRMMGSELR